LVVPLYEDWPISEDGIFGRAVTIFQHQKGYRFSIDAVLLAAFAVERALLLQNRIHRSICAVDLCAGSGVVPLAALHLADRVAEARPLQMLGIFEGWSAVEVQASMISLARANLRANQRDGVISLVHTDLRAWRPARSVDLLTCNPPYQPVAAGDVSRHPERAAARHEIHGELADIVATAKSMLCVGGVSLWVFPAKQSARLLRVFDCLGWNVSHIRSVHPFEEAPAELVLIEACVDVSGEAVDASSEAAGGQRSAQSPTFSRCVLYREHRVYTQTIEALLRGDPWAWLGW